MVLLRSAKGFTLIELLIVVAILGLLATIVIPRFVGHDERAYVAEAVIMLSAIRQAEADYYFEHSEYTNNLSELDVDVSSSSRFTYSVSGGAASTSITATRNGGSANFDGKTIILKMDGNWDQNATHPFRPS